jgi:hypothetical protein
MSELKIERIGGIGGYGLPGGRLKSRGVVATSDLSDADRAAIERLFTRGDAARDSNNPHGFRYRITRGGKTIEVAEDEAPAALTGAVRDEFE